MTIIATRRRPFSARLCDGVAHRLTQFAEFTQQTRRARPRRLQPFGLDERMLRDIGMSRSEFMAAEMNE